MQDSGSLAVFKVTARDQGHYKGLRGHLLPTVTFLVFCYSLHFTMQKRGACCLKMCYNMERSKGIFVRENYINSIVNENALNSAGSFMHYQVLPSNYLFQLFLTL